MVNSTPSQPVTGPFDFTCPFERPARVLTALQEELRALVARITNAYRDCF